MTPGKTSIQLLKSLLKKGDADAFKALYNVYYDRLFNFINSYTNSRELTQDIVQETFLKLWNTREKIEIEKSLGGYLYTIAYNTFINTHRKAQRNLKTLDALAYKKMNELIEEDSEKRSKKIQKVKEAIEKLPPKCKKIFLLSKYQGYSYSEIAEQLNISVKTVEAQMGNAFSRIRNEYKDDDFLNLFLFFWKRQYP